MKIACASLAGALIAVAARAQAPAYDVASIKRTAITSGVVEFQMRPGGRLAVFGMSLRDLVQRAYGSDEIQLSEQVVGGPDWAGTDRYDVLAATDRDVDSDPRQRPARMLAMLRTLLEDRFTLKVHMETREASAYALVVASRDRQLAPDLRASTIDCPAFIPGAPRPPPDPVRWCGIRGGGLSGVLKAQGLTMKEFAVALALHVAVARPVRDKTGLPGRYDFRFEFTPPFIHGPAPDSPGVPNPAADSGPTLFTAMQEQLGLKLQSEKAPTEFLVIDSAAHPTEN